MPVYTRRDLRPGAVDRARRLLRRGPRADQRQPVRQRHRDLHQRRRRRPALPERGRGRHGRHQRADPGADGVLLASAAGRPRCSATPTSTAPRACTSTPAARSSPSRWPDPATAASTSGLPTTHGQVPQPGSVPARGRGSRAQAVTPCGRASGRAGGDSRTRAIGGGRWARQVGSRAVATRNRRAAPRSSAAPTGGRAGAPRRAARKQGPRRAPGLPTGADPRGRPRPSRHRPVASARHRRARARSRCSRYRGTPSTAGPAPGSTGSAPFEKETGCRVASLDTGSGRAEEMAAGSQPELRRRLARARRWPAR